MKRPAWIISIFLATLPAGVNAQNPPTAMTPQSNCYSLIDRAVRVRLERIQEGNTIYFNRVLTRASGAIIERDSTHYHILTAFHFVEPLTKNYQLTDHGVIPDTSTRTISISFYDGRPTRDAHIEWYDEALDIALLKMPLHENISPLDPFVYGNSDQVRIGDEVIQMGHPLDLPYSMIKTEVVGIVNSAAFSFNYMGERFQLHGMAGSGISGGPLLNSRCELIGYTQFSRLDPERGAGFDMALRINDVARLLRLPKNNGRIMHAHLHIGAIPLYDLAEHIQSYLKNVQGVTEGILVTDVKDRSEAQKFGILPADIIVKLDAYRVRNLSDLTNRILFEYKPGDRVTFELYRRDANGQYVKHKLTGILTEARVNYYEKGK